MLCNYMDLLTPPIGILLVLEQKGGKRETIYPNLKIENKRKRKHHFHWHFQLQMILERLEQNTKTVT